MCQISWSLAVTSEQIAPALLCNVLTTASLWAMWMVGLEVEVAVCVGGFLVHYC